MKKILGTLAAVLIALGAFTLISAYTSPTLKVGYISNQGVYEEFVLKKELEAKVKNTQDLRKNILDSMLLNLQMLAREIETNKIKEGDKINSFETLRREYLVKEQQFGEENGRLEQQYSEQVWKQLNQYVQDFGKENGYAFIYGAVGDGSLMYGGEQYNLTKEIIEYANKKYNGQK